VAEGAIHFYCRKCGHVFTAEDPAACPVDGGLLIRFATGMPLVGEMIGFRYLLTGMIGEGGICSIFAALDKATKQRVAIKVMRPVKAIQDGWRHALLNEVSLARSISQENLVKVFQGGISQGGYVFLSMELLEGESLAARLARQGRLGFEDACRVAISVARALGAIHASGHVHRDVKPENIFLCASAATRELLPGNIKLMDLGVARPINAPAQGANVEGTPAYMSPEQVSGHQIDHRGDIYSLGIVLFEMLSGKPCFDACDEREVMLAHIREPAPLLPESILESPSGRMLGDLVSRMLGKQANQRPASTNEVVCELDAILKVRQSGQEWPDALRRCV